MKIIDAIVNKLDVFNDSQCSRFRAIESHKMLAAWVLALAAIITLGFCFHGQHIVFSGIAEASETTISVQEAVEVVKIHVVPGQEVKEGDTLVELSRPDLALRMNELIRELDAIEGRGSLNTAGIDQKVAEVQAALTVKRNTVNFEIEKLQMQYQQNRELAGKLKSLPAGSLSAVDSNDGLLVSIRNLQKELKVAEDGAASQIRLLRGSQGLEKTNSAAEAQALHREMDMLKEQQKELTIISKADWVVANVEVRDGEKVSSFNPLLTLTRKSPSLVRGYINEKVYSKIKVGDDVEIIEGNGEKVIGSIIGMSSRIVPFPLRLLKMPDMPMYGREVSIRVPEQNSMLLGERVSISELSGLKKILKGSNGGNR
ncbi:MAG: HlyD family efflux transporter periplasmic adaptor subunit [Fibrobacteraceae bacterium]